MAKACNASRSSRRLSSTLTPGTSDHPLLSESEKMQQHVQTELGRRQFSLLTAATTLTGLSTLLVGAGYGVRSHQAHQRETRRRQQARSEAIAYIYDHPEIYQATNLAHSQARNSIEALQGVELLKCPPGTVDPIADIPELVQVSIANDFSAREALSLRTAKQLEDILVLQAANVPNATYPHIINALPDVTITDHHTNRTFTAEHLQGIDTLELQRANRQ